MCVCVHACVRVCVCVCVIFYWMTGKTNKHGVTCVSCFFFARAFQGW